MKNILLFIGILGLLSACGEGGGGKKSEGSKSGSVVQNYVTKGDPHLLLAGASFNPGSPFTEENIKDLENFSLLGSMSYSEREKPPVETEVNLEKENAPKGPQSKSAPDLGIVVSRLADGTWVAKIKTLELGVLFKADSQNRLQAFAMTSESGEVEQIRPLHWSRTPDGNVISLLFDGSYAETGKFVAALYFERKARKVIESPRVDVRFQFSAGPGVALGWDAKKVLKINACASPKLFPTVQHAIATWQAPLQNRLNLEITQVNNYFPFSDLNQHCVYMVDTYIYDVRDKVAGFGTTVSIASSLRNERIDSDVLMFSAEFTKFRKSLLAQGGSEEQVNKIVSKNFVITYVHELGHLLGLAHKFDGTTSVMSYKFEDSALSPYDVEAIQALYPLRRP